MMGCEFFLLARFAVLRCLPETALIFWPSEILIIEFSQPFSKEVGSPQFGLSLTVSAQTQYLDERQENPRGLPISCGIGKSDLIAGEA
jgi:hypothetical protein